MTRREQVVTWLPAAALFVYLSGYTFAGHSLGMRTAGAAFMAMVMQVLGMMAYWLATVAWNNLAGSRTTNWSHVIDASGPALLLGAAVWIFAQVGFNQKIERLAECVDRDVRELHDSAPSGLVQSCYAEIGDAYDAGEQ